MESQPKRKLSLPGEAGNLDFIQKFHSLPLGVQYVVRIERLARSEKREPHRKKLEHTAQTLEGLLLEEDRPYLQSFRDWESRVVVRKMRTLPIGYLFND